MSSSEERGAPDRDELARTVGPDRSKHSLDRRGFMKLAGGTAVALGTVGAAPPKYSPVGRAEAIAPLVVAGAVAGSVTLGWCLREFEVIGADATPEGLTADALKEDVSNTMEARRSNNQSTFVDNRNMVPGVENSAYADGKVAAIEGLNAEQSESEVTTKATTAADSYEATVTKNLLKSWNEAVQETIAVANTIESHADVVLNDVFDIPQDWYDTGSNTVEIDYIQSVTRDVTLADGSTFTLERIKLGYLYAGTNNDHAIWDPLADETSGTAVQQYPYLPKTYNEPTELLNRSEWQGLYSDITTAFNNARDGLSLWVGNIYSQVQAGELDTAELLTNRELANMTADDEEYNRAISDLMALNVAVDLDREAEVYLPNYDATLYGSLSTTGEKSITTGSIDPSADSYSYYLTYDVSSGEGVWSSYETGVDGGTVTFTEEPYPSTEFHIHTSAGETAVVTASDFTEDTTNGVWTADLSGQLETSITNVDSVDYYGDVDGTTYETIQLQEVFEVKNFTDDEGTTYDSADYTQATPHDDTNYITKEEWQEQEDRYQKLIDKYDAATGGGGGLDLSGFDMFGLPGEAVAAIGAGVAMLGLSRR